MDGSYLIAGLGNPGSEYAETRHNAGFMLVERLAGRWNGQWANERRFNARVARCERQARRVFLVEPLTYMNLSGESVAAVLTYHRIPSERLLVVVDDADLPFGEIRLRSAGSPGGHHGLESVEAHLNTREYARLRVGIGRRSDGVRQITGHVLGRFSRDEFDLLEKVLERAAGQAECWLMQGVQKAMSQFNGAVVAPMSKDSE
jgi:PTH1 family peptidyl-tRNA hydrolase